MPARGGPQAARVRAARAYADRDTADFAKALGWSKETLARVERGARTCDTDELRLIAQATDVPLTFLEHGFLSEGRDELADRVADLERVVTRLVGGDIPLPGGALGRVLRGE